MSESISVGLWNANGIGSTITSDVLQHCSSFHFLFITETWLLPSSRLPTNWSQFHLYGTPVPGARNRGSGGVSCLVSPSCPFPVYQLPSPNAYTLSLKVGSLRIHCLYVSPSLPTDVFSSVLSSIPLHPNTLICGDFNARLGDFVGDSAANARGRVLLPWCDAHSFEVLNASLANGVPTWLGFRDNRELSSIIDLFLTNIPLLDLDSPSISVASDLSLGSDHRLLCLSFSSFVFDSSPPSDSSGSSCHPRRLWNLSRLQEADPRLLYSDTFATLSAPLLSQLSELVSSPPCVRPPIDALVDQFNDAIYSSLDIAVSPRSPRPSNWKKFWNPSLESSARLRDSCYRRWRHASGVEKIASWSAYQDAQVSFRRAVAQAKRSSWRSFCSLLESDFSKATSKIKDLKRRHTSSASFSHPDGPSAAVEIMSAHLASVYNGHLLPSLRPLVPCLPVPAASLPFPLPPNLSSSSPFDPSLLRLYIRQLPSRKAPGADHIRAEMLKPLSATIAPLLSLLFTLCWNWSYVPPLWRAAQVVPIFKKGDPSLPSNYRPISLTSVLRKLFEFSLAPLLSRFSPSLDLAQGGFRPRRSALDQALCLHELMHAYFLQHRHHPVVAFLDIKSAYDTVDRQVIWSSLAASGTPLPLLSLLSHLFDDVSVSVLISNHSSSPFSPATGVLQGSVLSPHLYSIYINSLPALLRSVATPSSHCVPCPSSPSSPPSVPLNSLLFADDVAIFGSHSSVADMLSLCEQHSLSLGYRWNPAKCAVINHSSSVSSSRLSLYGDPLPLSDSFVYLGVPFCSRGVESSTIVSSRSPGVLKVMGLLNYIGVNRNAFSLFLCSRIYSTFVRPKFEYGLAISHLSASDYKSLERLQDRCLRLLVGGHSTSSTVVLKHLTCLPSMRFRCDVLSARFALRSLSLPSSCLLSLLIPTLRVSRLEVYLKQTPLYLALSTSPSFTPAKFHSFLLSYRQDSFDSFLSSTDQVLIRGCRPLLGVDPILFVPCTRAERSRLVRWRLGWLPGRPEPCLCNLDTTSRRHFTDCLTIPVSFWVDLPPAPPDHHPIDFAISSLPSSRSAPCPLWWPSLLAVLRCVDMACHPTKLFPADPSPGSLWLKLRPPRPIGPPPSSA